MSSAADLAAVVQVRQFLGRQHLLQLRGRLAGLAAECASSAITAKRLPLRCRQLPHRLAARRGRSGWCRRRSSCRRPAPRRAARSCSALALDRGDDAGRALEAEDRFLQLGVDHVAVGHHEHRVEHLLVLRVMQVGEEVRRPGDGVGLARPGRVLDQVLAAGALVQHRGLQLPGRVELVVAREDHAA